MRELDRKGKVLLGGTCALVALVVVLAAIALALRGGEDPAPEDTGPSVPAGELLVEDLYEGQRLIPEFDVEKNELDPELFQEGEDGFLHYGEALLGVDVAEYQGAIDWGQVKKAGIDFAILRLGWRGMTEGGLNLDATYQQNIEGAVGAGMPVGVYFFSQAVSEEEAREEAAFVLEALGGRELQYPVVFDWEQPFPSESLPAEDLRAYDMTGEQVSRFALAFCQEIEKGGYTPCVYTNKTMAYGFFDLELLKDYPLWYAEYQPAPSLYYGFDLWQYTASGSVSGIDGDVDLNLCFGSF